MAGRFLAPQLFDVAYEFGTRISCIIRAEEAENKRNYSAS